MSETKLPGISGTTDTGLITKTPQTYKMPEGMEVKGYEEKQEVIEEMITRTPEEEVKEWLDEVHDIRIPQNETGVVNDGFENPVALARVKEKAKKIIQLNISKLYKTKIKQVAIVGTAMTFKEAPYDDPSWEIWGVNDHWNLVPRATRWFESQDEEHCSKTACGHDKTRVRMDWIKKSPIPVYMNLHYDSAPMSVRFPLKQIKKWMSDMDAQGDNYFTNTVTYMIALACYEGFDRIHLYGVDMAVGSEYEKQRPSCEFWLGIAKGLGIELYIPDQSDLLKCLERYGMDQEGEKKIAAPFLKKMKDRLAFQNAQVGQINASRLEHQKEINRLNSVYDSYTGSIEDLKQTMKVWGEM